MHPHHQSDLSLASLHSAFLTMKTEKELAEFILDLCTPAEWLAMSDRWTVAQMVFEDIPYRAIAEQTKVSTATITRVARSLSEGNGYKLALSRRRKRPK